MKQSLKPLIYAFTISILYSSCAPLKPYQRIYINDPEMQMSASVGKNFEQYVQSIREGAISIGNKKGNGGCGCN